VAEGSQKIAKANWRFHPPVRRGVFDAVLKHGWPSAPCQGANMADLFFLPSIILGPPDFFENDV
jgi:hypothetical protein